MIEEVRHAPIINSSYVPSLTYSKCLYHPDNLGLRRSEIRGFEEP